MIGKMQTGSGFLGLTRYLLHGEKGQEPEPDRVAWTASRNLATTDPELAPAEMRALAAEAPRVEKPVLHMSLSAAPNEELTQEQWERIIDRHLADLGLDDHQVLIVAHRDTAHRHVHLVINQVHPERLRDWDDSHSRFRQQKSLRHIERDFGLREVPGHLYQLPGQERPERDQGLTSGEAHEKQDKGHTLPVERWREELRPLMREAASWAELEEGLAAHGLRVQKRGRGMVVTDGETMIKASRIDRKSSLHYLEERFGMAYNDWREERRQVLEAARELEARTEERAHLEDLEARLAQKLATDREATLRAQQAAEPGQRAQPRGAEALTPEQRERARRRLGRVRGKLEKATSPSREKELHQELLAAAGRLGVNTVRSLLPREMGEVVTRGYRARRGARAAARGGRDTAEAVRVARRLHELAAERRHLEAQAAEVSEALRVDRERRLEVQRARAEVEAARGELRQAVEAVLPKTRAQTVLARFEATLGEEGRPAALAGLDRDLRRHGRRLRLRGTKPPTREAANQARAIAPRLAEALRQLQTARRHPPMPAAERQQLTRKLQGLQAKIERTASKGLEKALQKQLLGLTKKLGVNAVWLAMPPQLRAVVAGVLGVVRVGRAVGRFEGPASQL